MQRLVLLVDGFNLYHALDNLRQPQLKWLDLWCLGQHLSRPKSDQLSAADYFSAFANWLPDKANADTGPNSATRAVCCHGLGLNRSVCLGSIAGGSSLPRDLRALAKVTTSAVFVACARSSRRATSSVASRSTVVQAPALAAFERASASANSIGSAGGVLGRSSGFVVARRADQSRAAPRSGKLTLQDRHTLTQSTSPASSTPQCPTPAQW